ncbi:hypothetical protein K493DRAFT_344459 [Basidiobolus meristosporus CBS 931.73]|uniref:CS domain-containing protein n=1 Tax=Basidiobolus meristosporus CBS 931.73 TaxID=1314790 RepID=A0A1Y1Z8M7_9FUNG|nr:hypothetical protein K493DRAFT_344459 [Basidiobolus meristosporus CBS 931.73]|eukprot:ORY06611.1 hypothetical protein K493DRAFT_344459 [Basidiobolus meristosporus CBS 931.73]
MSLPIFRLRQTQTHVTILVEVPLIQEASVQIRNDRNSLTLTFTDAEEQEYELPLDFEQEIDPSGIKTSVCETNLVLLFHKQLPGEWKSVYVRESGEKHFLTEARIRQLVAHGEQECPWSKSDVHITAVEVDRKNPSESLEFEVRF